MHNLVDNHEALLGMWEGECQGCERYGRINDLSLCKDCAVKLERDLIRQRDWEYLATVYGLSS